MAQFDVYKHEMTFGVAGVLASTSFYYAQQEADTSDGRQIAESLETALNTALWSDYLRLAMSSETIFEGSRTQKIAPEKDTPSVNATPGGLALETGGALANATAQVITKYPGTWDRAFICRNYLPGMPELRYKAGIISEAWLNDMQVLAEAQELLTINIVTPEALSFDQVCFSATKWKNFDPLTQSITEVYSVVNSVKVQTVLGTQRRRRPPRNTAPTGSP